MKKWGAVRLVLTLIAGLVFWAIIAAVCLCIGSTGTFGWPAAETRGIRLQVVLLASLIGAALAAAGVVYQAILRNPLADPYLLGASSGASLLSFIWRLPFAAAAAGSILAAVSQQAFSFAGALISVGVVLAIASRRGRLEPVTLLLVGVIINAINGALFLLLNGLVPELAAGTGNALTFLVGGIQTNLLPRQIKVAAIGVGVGWIVLMAWSGQLNVATLGESEAEALGVRIHRVRWLGLIVASIVTAAAVAVSGPIGFVGLICPHLARLVVGPDTRRLLPISTALGAALLTAADAVTRGLSGARFINTVLPVGVLTALLGGPFFLLLLWQTRTRSMSD